MSEPQAKRIILEKIIDLETLTVNAPRYGKEWWYRVICKWKKDGKLSFNCSADKWDILPEEIKFIIEKKLKFKLTLELVSDADTG